MAFSDGLLQTLSCVHSHTQFSSQWGLQPSSWALKRTRTQRSGTRSRTRGCEWKLDGCRVAPDFAAWAYTVCRSLNARGEQIREQEVEYEYEEDKGQ